jgi:hypothetical protein
MELEGLEDGTLLGVWFGTADGVLEGDGVPSSFVDGMEGLEDRTVLGVWVRTADGVLEGNDVGMRDGMAAGVKAPSKMQKSSLESFNSPPIQPATSSLASRKKQIKPTSQSSSFLHFPSHIPKKSGASILP